MSVFERYLTVWVFVCIIVGVLVGQVFPEAFQAIGRMGGGEGQPAGRAAHLGDDHPDAGEGGFLGPARSPAARSRHRRHAVRELARQAFLDGAAGVDLHPAPVRAVAAGRTDRQLHRRADPARRGTVHGHGVRVEPADQRRPDVHAHAGRAQRLDHGRRVRAARGTAAWHCRHHGAVGHAHHLRRALHRHPRDHRAALAPLACSPRGRPRSTRRWPASGRGRLLRCC